MRQMTVTIALLVLAACGPRYGPTTQPRPEPGYTPVVASPEAAWDAAVDFLVDNGIDFAFIHQDMRLAKITVVLTTGPVARGNYLSRNLEASTYADCGTRNNDPRAGWGTLKAEVAVRVRASDEQTLVKVVVPTVYQEEGGTVIVRCVST